MELPGSGADRFQFQAAEIVEGVTWWLGRGVSDQNRDTASRDGQSLDGEGWELEVTANPTRNWSIRAAYSYTDRTRMLVLRSGTAKAGVWVQERRNVLKDFQLAFGDVGGQLGGLAIAIRRRLLLRRAPG